jgi:putative ABC transport system permease protein
VVRVCDGLAAGLGAAALIRALFTGIGFSLPSNGLTFEPRTAIVGLLVGVLVTIAAGVVPAVRAMRVAPLEALRESMAPVAPGAASRLLSGLVVTGLTIGGVALIASSSGPTSSRLTSSGVGAGLLLLAVVLLTPRAVGRATRVLGWPLERGGNIIGRLARENAARNPSRTAVSASSLMIGLALVLFVTVYATGLRTSSNRIIDQTLKGDFTIESTDGTSLIPAASARAAALVPQVEAVSSFKTATARLGSASSVTATGIDPTTIGQVYKFDWIDGSDAILAGLGLGDAILERDTAQRAHVHAGDLIRITTETGLRGTVTVRGIYRDKALLPGFALPRIEFDRIFHQPRLEAVLVKLLPGADRAAAGSQLRQALSSLPGVTARSQQQLRSEVSGRVNSILILFYALLAMSVLLSLLGLVNTLTLSIHERTRELGLLRAVGMTPRQSRELVRGESVITAAMGAVIGIVLGLVFAWVITRALRSEGVTFSIPWLQVIAMFALGLLAGVVASIPPARRAARLDVLAAIANE